MNTAATFNKSQNFTALASIAEEEIKEPLLPSSFNQNQVSPVLKFDGVRVLYYGEVKLNKLYFFSRMRTLLLLSDRRLIILDKMKSQRSSSNLVF